MALHHAWRLRRLGRPGRAAPARRRQPLGARGPAAAGRVHARGAVDGAEFLPAIAEAIRGARRSVRLAGWRVSPRLRAGARRAARASCASCWPTRPQRVDVRVLLWAGAPLQAVRPEPGVRARRARRARARDAASGVRSTRDERPLHCHHEKLVVVDDEVAFVGGIDLTDLGGDRYDTPEHPARGRLGWHDVGTRLRGPAVADVARALRTALDGGHRRARCPRRRPPRPARATSRSRSCARSPRSSTTSLPRGDFRIIEAYLRALRSRPASWSTSRTSSSGRRRSSTSCADKLRRPPADGFASSSCCPRSRTTAQDDTRGMLALLADADAGAGRFLATTIERARARPSTGVYVHAKVGIVDDRWLTLGSANLNAHSFFNDTEVNVVTCDPRARARHAAAAVGRAPRAAGRRGRRRPDRRRRPLWRPIARAARAPRARRAR